MLLLELLTLIVPIGAITAVILMFREALARVRRRGELEVPEGVPQDVVEGRLEQLVNRTKQELISGTSDGIDMQARRSEPSPPGSNLLDFDLSGSHVDIIVPPAPSVDPLKLLYVEADIRAVEAIGELRPSLLAKGSSVNRLVDPSDYDLKSKANLVLLCSPRSNRVTAEILAHPDVKHAVNLEFSPISGASGLKSDAWALSFGNVLYQSPYYDQEQKFRRDPTGHTEGFTDFGVFAKFSHPYHKELTVILSAGIRSLGTWGAAAYVEQYCEALAKVVGRDNFTALVQVRRDEPRGPRVATSLVALQVFRDGRLVDIDLGAETLLGNTATTAPERRRRGLKIA
jgi:hypothetical protein